MVDFKKMLKNSQDAKKGREILDEMRKVKKPPAKKVRRSPVNNPLATPFTSPGISLTKDQDSALLAIQRWLRDPSARWMFSLAGYAGTGKTTLLQHLIAHLDCSFLCAAPTGKAASVLRAKIPGLIVKTVHQLLYAPQGQVMSEIERLERELDVARTDGEPTAALLIAIKAEKERLAREDVRFTPSPSADLLPGKLVIVDEASMVSRKMLSDFEQTECKLLFVGDDGQLPPVKDEGWFIGNDHDAKLSEVMRQALDSPIIRFSMQVRNGEVNFDDFREGACIITTKDKLTNEEWLAANQIITGSNASRQKINRFARKQAGRNESQLPVAGEKMICLKNDHYKLPPWINGVQFNTTADTEDFGQDTIPRLTCDYDGVDQQMDFYPWHCQRHYIPDLPEEPREMRRGLFEADYAYAITVHKSQGSEWPFVIIADDGMQAGNVEFRKRWLYTGITRAKDRLILVR